MNADLMTKFIWVAGGIQAGIVFANFLLPRMLRVRDGVISLPPFLKQVFYVHWLYIVIVVGFFSALSFGFAHELSRSQRARQILERIHGCILAAANCVAVVLLRPGDPASAQISVHAVHVVAHRTRWHLCDSGNAPLKGGGYVESGLCAIDTPVYHWW